MSFLLRNEYRPDESGMDRSTPVNPMAAPLGAGAAICMILKVKIVCKVCISEKAVSEDCS